MIWFGAFSDRNCQGHCCVGGGAERLQGWILMFCSISAGLFFVFWLNGAALSSCEVLNILPLYQKQDSFSYKG